MEKCFGGFDDTVTEEHQSSQSKLKSSAVIQVLQQFIESSSFAEFGVRMDMLKGFVQYLRYIEVPENCRKRRDTLVRIIHNLQLYFDQFRSEIQAKILAIRQPIEKKLREFVKIESYNKDLSYFSMKNNIARVHRNLHKFLKEFEVQLSVRISSMFVLRDTSAQQLNTINSGSVKLFTVNVEHCMVENVTIETDALTIDVDATKFKYLPKVRQLFVTARKISRQAITHSHFPTAIKSLNILLQANIETGDYLRRLEVDRSQERPKQKSQAKQILSQKRKALSDLFKTLTTLGINYKTGLRECVLSKDLVDFKIESFSMTDLAETKAKRPIDQTLLCLSDGIDTFFANCVFKLKLLETVLVTPSTELGMPNLERIKGFAVDLFLLVQSQRTLLSQNVCNLNRLSGQLQQIIELDETLCADGEAKANTSYWQRKRSILLIKDRLCAIINVFEQYELLWKCIPSAGDETDSKLCVLADREPLSHFEKIKFVSSTILSAAKKMFQDDIGSLEGVTFFSHELTTKIEAGFKRIVNQIDDFSIRELGTDKVTGKAIRNLLHQLRTDESQSSRINMDIVVDEQLIAIELENVIHSMCLSMEILYKQLNDKEIGVVESNDKEDNQIFKNHLRTHIHESLQNDCGRLNVSKITTKLSNILLSMLYNTNNCTSESMKTFRRICSVLPLLNQYNLLCKFYLSQHISAHRVSTKMLSVMLSVFTELGAKGFCVPPDLMQDEDDGEKQKNEDQKKSEGFGLEDGTGENDVSDK